MAALIRHKPWRPPPEDPAFESALWFSVYCGPFIVGTKYSDDALCFWESNNTFADWTPRGGECWSEPMRLSEFLKQSFRKADLSETDLDDDEDGDMDAWDVYRDGVVERSSMAAPVRG